MTLVLCAGAALGCQRLSSRGAPRTSNEAASSDSAVGKAPGESARPDSLALTAPRGVQVWYTLSREVEAPGGRRCEHRALEIRQGGRRRVVPLLYTASPVELVNDSTIAARLWTACEPGDRYLVSLTTGLPTPAPHATSR